MKKYLRYLPIALAFIGLASCSQDRDPKYHDPMPGSFKLNKPAMHDLEIILTPGHTLEFSCSQPDYGFAATAAYSLDMSLTEEFTDFYTLTPYDANNTIISVDQAEVATGYCTLLGIDSEEAYAEQYPDGFPVSTVYFRANCQIPGIESSYITSNIVTYNYLKPYFAVAVPGYIYLVGKPSGWMEPSEGNAAAYASWRLFEPADAIGSKIYSGVFEVGAGSDAIFRFYSALTGWDGGASYGTQQDDNAIEFPDFSAGEFEHELVPGKGSFSFPNWPGGEMTMVVDMSNPNAMTVTFTAGAVEVFVPKHIYLMGSLQGWTEPTEANASAYDDWKLSNSASAPGIYTGSFPVPADKLDVYFRFAYEFAGWDAGQWGVQEPDESIECSLTNGSFTGPYVPGKGSWNFKFTEPGTMKLAVDTDNETVTVDYVTD